MRSIGLLLLASACGGKVVCGNGTTLQNGACVPTSTVTCGDGTVPQGSSCVPASTVTCGDGTTLDSGQCVPNPTDVTPPADPTGLTAAWEARRSSCRGRTPRTPISPG